MSDDAKPISDLPAKGQQPPKGADEKVPAAPVKDADAVKGGAAKKIVEGSWGGNHNQTLRARRASHSQD